MFRVSIQWLKSIVLASDSAREPTQEVCVMSIFSSPQQAGNALLRISLGLMFIAHGLILKFFTFTLAGTAQFFESMGLPGALAYVVFAVETVGGVLLLINYRTRWVALGLIPVLLGALWVHLGNGWVFSNPNGGWEYPLYLIVISVVVALQAEPARAKRGLGSAQPNLA
jgi:putative oxidoreductase